MELREARMIRVLGHRAWVSFRSVQRRRPSRDLAAKRLNGAKVFDWLTGGRPVFSHREAGFCGDVAMVFREGPHIQLKTRLYIVAARGSRPILDRHLSS
jgi:hypothetical protein